MKTALARLLHHIVFPSRKPVRVHGRVSEVTPTVSEPTEAVSYDEDSETREEKCGRYNRRHGSLVF